MIWGQTSFDCLLVLVNFGQVQVPNFLNNEKAKKIEDCPTQNVIQLPHFRLASPEFPLFINQNKQHTVLNSWLATGYAPKVD